MVFFGIIIIFSIIPLIICHASGLSLSFVQWVLDALSRIGTSLSIFRAIVVFGKFLPWNAQLYLHFHYLYLRSAASFASFDGCGFYGRLRGLSIDGCCGFWLL